MGKSQLQALLDARDFDAVAQKVVFLTIRRTRNTVAQALHVTCVGDMEFCTRRKLRMLILRVYWLLLTHPVGGRWHQAPPRKTGLHCFCIITCFSSAAFTFRLCTVDLFLLQFADDSK